MVERNSGRWPKKGGYHVTYPSDDYWYTVKQRPLKDYMNDGLFDLDIAHSERSEDRANGAPIDFTRCPVGNSYITMVAHPSMYNKQESIDNWVIVGLYPSTWINAKPTAVAYAVRHLHLTSELTLATIRTDKLKWRCCMGNCGEQVPIGVLWAARTQNLRGLT